MANGMNSTPPRARAARQINLYPVGDMAPLTHHERIAALEAKVADLVAQIAALTQTPAPETPPEFPSRALRWSV